MASVAVGGSVCAAVDSDAFDGDRVVKLGANGEKGLVSVAMGGVAWLGQDGGRAGLPSKAATAAAAVR